MANMMRTVIGPFAQQILSVMHLRIATETLHHVRRAMNREDMFHLVTKKALNAEIEKENALVRGSTIPVTEEEIQKRTKLIQRYEREIASIEAKNNATEKELALAESRRRTVEKHKADIASSTLSHQAETDAIMAKNAAFNGLTMGIGVTGSAMMMFGGSQRAIRAGMILNTTALSLQVFKLMASTIATNKDTIAKMKNTVSAALAFRGNIKLSISFEAVAKSAKSAAASTLGFILSIAPLAGFFLALGGIAYVLAGTIDDVSDSVDGTNQSFVNLSETIDVVNQMSMDEIQANIESTQASIDNLKDTESDLGKEILTTKQNDLDKYKQSKQLALLQTKDAQELARKIEEAQKLSDKRQKGRDFDFKRGRFTRTSSERARAMSALRRENKELFEAFEENGITSLDALAEYNIGTLEATASNVAGFTDDITGSFNDAEDSMHSFNNAREELFFGFASSNLTGDLIRQVQQQGVENLITNTEVIMTNNFNGMTVPEVADQILEEIESRANLSGISLSMSAA